MGYSVPSLSIVFMAAAAAAGILIPAALLLVFRKRLKADMLPFFIGCAVFAVFALLLEGAINFFVLRSDTGKAIQGSAWLLAVYGGLMAGLFEETGRFTAFKTVLRKKLGNDKNALMYGAGHGGFEALVVLGFGMISNIVLALMLNAGMADQLTANLPEATARTLRATYAAISTLPPATFLAGIVERIAAVTLHISLSVLVWFAAKDKGRFRLYLLAVLLHALIDASVVILSKYVRNVWSLEGVVCVFVVCCIFIARAVWNRSASDTSVVIKACADEAENPAQNE